MSVDLNHLRIREDVVPHRGVSRALLLLLVILVPAGFAAGWFLRGRSAGGTGAPEGPSLRTEGVRVEGEAGASSAGNFSEGGWIEVPSYHPVVVSALVPGRIEELTVLEGSAVEAGQVIARLYAKDLSDSLRLAEAEVDSVRAELDLMLAGYRKEDVDKAGFEVERLAREAEYAATRAARTASLVPSGAASDEERERDESAARAAGFALDSARAELARMKAGFRPEEIGKGRAALARAEAARDLARSRLSYAEVKSPAAGVVLERHVTAGTYLSEGNLRVVSLYDPGDLQVRVDVRQENAARVRIGQTVEISTDAEPAKSYHGAVIRVEPLADLKKNTVQAKIRITDPGPGLHPEMICRVRFAVPEAAPAPADAPKILTVPATAVRTEAGRSFVFRVRDGAARRAEVRIGERRGDRVVVEAGLAAGDVVVSDPPSGLEDGATVGEGAR